MEPKDHQYYVNLALEMGLKGEDLNQFVRNMMAVEGIDEATARKTIEGVNSANQDYLAQLKESQRLLEERRNQTIENQQIVTGQEFGEDNWEVENWLRGLAAGATDMVSGLSTYFSGPFGGYVGVDDVESALVGVNQRDPVAVKEALERAQKSGELRITPTMFQDLREGVFRPFSESMRANMDQYDTDVLGSIADGNLYTAAKQAVTTGFESAPYMAAAILGGGAGVALGGLSSAGNAYEEVKDNPDIGDWERLGYAAIAGSVESVSNLVGGKIISNALKESASKVASTIASRQYVRGLARSSSYGFAAEGIEEGIAGALEASNRYLFLEDAPSTKDMLLDIGRSALNGAITGGAIGGTLGGSAYSVAALRERAISTPPSMLTNSPADREVGISSPLRMSIDRLSREVATESDPTRRKELGAELRQRKIEFDQQVRDRQSVYRAIRVKSPDTYEELVKADNEILRLVGLAKSIDAKNTGDNAEIDAMSKEVRQRLAQAISTRAELFSSASNIDTNLTPQELIQDALNDINARLRDSRSDLSSIKNLEVKTSEDRKAYISASKQVQSLTKKRAELMKLMGDYDAASRPTNALGEVFDYMLDSNRQEVVSKIEDIVLSDYSSARQASAISVITEDQLKDDKYHNLVYSRKTEGGKFYDFTPEDRVEFTSAEEIDLENRQGVDTAILSLTRNLMSAFRGSGVKVVIHKNRDSFEAAVGYENLNLEEGATVNATYNKSEKTIHISLLDEVNGKVNTSEALLDVRHEFVHGALRDIISSESPYREQVFESLKTLASKDYAIGKLMRDAEEVYSSLKNTDLPLYQEEVIARVIEGIGYADLKPSTIKRLSDYFKDLISRVFGGSSPYNITSSDDFLAIARKFNRAAATGAQTEVISDFNAEGTQATVTSARRHPGLNNQEVTFFENVGTRFSPKMKINKMFVNDYFDFREKWAEKTDNGRRKDLLQNAYYIDKNGNPKKIEHPTPIRGYVKPVAEAIQEPTVENEIIEKTSPEIVQLQTIISNMMPASQVSSFNNVTEFAEYAMDLFKNSEARIKKAYGIADFQDYDSEGLKKYLVDAYTYEALVAISTHPEALGWYDEKTTNALSIISLVHPEISTDETSEAVFKLALAITSNGNKVDKNFEEADSQYTFFKQTGRFKQTNNVGVQSDSINKTFEFLNLLLDKGVTLQQLSFFLTKKFSVSDLAYRDKNGKTVKLISGELNSTEVYGASILGPKIGNGFFMNLYGEFGQLTMDRWFMRTYGRLTGTLLKETDFDKASARLESAVDNLSESDVNLIDSYKDKFSSATLEDKANIIAKLAMIKSVREELFSQNANLAEVRKASNEFKKSSGGELADSPRNGSERRFIRNVFKSVEQNLLSQYGVSINQADLQAVIWYPEKALYKKMKESVSKNEMNIDTNEQPDYETAAGKLARGKYGITDDKINQVVRSAGATAKAAANRGSFARRFGELGEYGDRIAGKVKEVISAVNEGDDAAVIELRKQLDSLSIPRPVGPNPDNGTYNMVTSLRKKPAPRSPETSTGETWDAFDRSWFQTSMDNVQRKFQDKYKEIWVLQEGVRKSKGGQLEEDQDFKMAEELMYGKAAEDLKALDKNTQEIYDYMRKNNISDDELTDFLYAMHAEERNKALEERTNGKNTMGSGITTEDANNYLKSIPRDKRAKLDELSKKVYSIAKNTRETMVKYNLESKESVDVWESMYTNYVPLWGFALDEKNEDSNYYPTGGAGIQSGRSPVKKAKGRFTEATHLLANVISQNAAVHIQARKNEALQSLYNLVQNNPNEKVWYISAKAKNPNKAVGVRINGREMYIIFQNERHAMALKDASTAKLNDMGRLLMNSAQFVRMAFTTYSPEFVFDNFVRDIQMAMANVMAEADMEGGIIKGKDIAEATLSNVAKNTKAVLKLSFNPNAKVDPKVKAYWNEFLEDGGKTGWMYTQPLSEIQAQIDRETDPDRRAARAAKIAKEKIGGTVEAVNDAIENTTRFAAYMAARDAGVSRQKSAQLAKNLTVNFNKSGEYGSVLNTFYLFFNSSVQGSYRLLKTMITLTDKKKPNGELESWYKRLNGGQKLAAGLTVMGAMLTLYNMAVSEDDEEGFDHYDSIPEYEKSKNLIFMTSGKSHVALPLPYGLSMFPGFGRIVSETSDGRKEPLEATVDIVNMVFSNFSPISFGESEKPFGFAKSFVPSMLRPFVDLMTNESYFAEKIYREKLDYEVARSNSSLAYRSKDFVKEFFSWMNDVTGGDEFESGAIDVNPDALSYLFGYYTGGAGRFVGKVINVMDKTASGEDVSFNDIPWIGKYYKERPEWYSVSAYYDAMDEVKLLVEQYKASDVEERKDPKFKDIISMYEAMKTAERRMRMIRKEKRAMKSSGNTTDPYFMERQKQIKDAEDQAIMEFNRAYNATQK